MLYPPELRARVWDQGSPTSDASAWAFLPAFLPFFLPAFLPLSPLPAFSAVGLAAAACSALAAFLSAFLAFLSFFLPFFEPATASAATPISDSRAAARSRTSLTALTTASRGPCQARHCFSALPSREPSPAAMSPRVSPPVCACAFFFATLPPLVGCPTFILRRARSVPSAPAPARRRHGA